jgi:hypothetical protein
LIAWGRGKAMNNAENGYPHQTPFSRLAGAGDIGTAPLSDDDHIRIDAAVSSLKVRKPTHYKAIKYAYVKSLKDHQIGKRMKPRCSRSQARDIRMQAEHWLEGRLEHELYC